MSTTEPDGIVASADAASPDHGNVEVDKGARGNMSAAVARSRATTPMSARRVRRPANRWLAVSAKNLSRPMQIAMIAKSATKSEKRAGTKFLKSEMRSSAVSGIGIEVA